MRNLLGLVNGFGPSGPAFHGSREPRQPVLPIAAASSDLARNALLRGYLGPDVDADAR
jgi:hypothetical protein